VILYLFYTSYNIYTGLRLLAVYTHIDQKLANS